VLRAHDARAPKLTRPAEPLAALEAHQLVPDPAYRTHWLSARPFQEDPATAHATLRRLVADVPVRELCWNPPQDCDHSTASLLSTLFDIADSDPAAVGRVPAEPPATAPPTPGLPLPPDLPRPGRRASDEHRIRMEERR
jgi:hypothetical protein